MGISSSKFRVGAERGLLSPGREDKLPERLQCGLPTATGRVIAGDMNERDGVALSSAPLSLSPFSPSIDTVRALLADRALRDRTRLAYVEGVRFVHRAVATRTRLLALVRCASLLRSPSGQRLVREQKRAGTPVIDVDEASFRGCSLLGAPQGIGAIAHVPEASLHRPFAPSRPLFVVVEAIRSPGNLGTILRTASAAGATGVVVLGDADPLDPKCVRSSMGGLFDLRLVRSDARDVAAWKRRRGGVVIGASSDARTCHRDVSWTGPTMLMLGCERRGLSAEQRALCDRVVRIPMRAGVDSLNVSAAAAVLLYEAQRQRSRGR